MSLHITTHEFGAVRIFFLIDKIINPTSVGPATGKQETLESTIDLQHDRKFIAEKAQVLFITIIIAAFQMCAVSGLGVVHAGSLVKCMEDRNRQNKK